jgi:hypothetical protein
LWEWIVFPLLQSSAAVVAALTGIFLAIVTRQSKRKRRSAAWR